MKYRLEALGPLPWPAIHEVLQTMTCAWADYEGFHVGTVPDEPPPYTHVWAWASDSWARVRVDGDGGIVGVLRPPDDARGILIEVTERTARVWSSEDLRVGPLPPEVVVPRATLLITDESLPITFVKSLGDPSH